MEPQTLQFSVPLFGLMFDAIGTLFRDLSGPEIEPKPAIKVVPKMEPASEQVRKTNFQIL